MKTRIAAIATVLVLGVAPISSAMAYERPSRYTGFAPYEADIEGGIDTRGRAYSRHPASCPMNSAAEGNANQQNFPVKQYGQTSGGSAC